MLVVLGELFRSGKTCDRRRALADQGPVCKWGVVLETWDFALDDTLNWLLIMKTAQRKWHY